MQTLLRQRQNGQYFRRPGSWTAVIEEATDLRSVSRAIEVVERGGYQDLEVVFLFDTPRRMSSVPVAGLMPSDAYRRRRALFREEADHEHSGAAEEPGARGGIG